MGGKYYKVHISGVELAKLAKVQPQFISEMKRLGRFDGCMRKKQGSRRIEYNRKKCLKILGSLDPAKKRKNAEESNGEYLNERVKLLQAQRERLQFDAQVRKGLYTPAAEELAEAHASSLIFRDCLLNLPSRLSSLIAPKSKKKEAEIFQLLRRELNSAFKDLQAALTKAKDRLGVETDEMHAALRQIEVALFKAKGETAPGDTTNECKA
jgi:hypothetical protein